MPQMTEDLGPGFLVKILGIGQIVAMVNKEGPQVATEQGNLLVHCRFLSLDRHFDYAT